MSTSKHIDKICIAVISATLILAILLGVLANKGIIYSDNVVGYENRLFSNDKVHTIDIVMDDWDTFIENCESEEYSSCTAIIDGEKYSNIGIRAKGNTSLSSVKSLGSQRYSFKLEFDQYDDGKSYYGLDKLCLNNLIQDNTMMKDYLVYQMMYEFGVDAPLSSYTYITVNGSDWGLYLAVEGVEDSFLQRNYGSESGDLYKPDSLSFGGGGPGNGKDFDMGDFDFSSMGDFDPSSMGDFDPSSLENFDFSNMPGQSSNDKSDSNFGKAGAEGFGGFGGFGMGSDDVKLKYSDDDPDSYSNIFDNAKTTVSKKDKERLIASLKNLSEYSDLENTLDIEEVLRYFVIHNFVINGDSYTGTMIHNYYLHENDGKLSMIPWDYNLAYGTFMGGDAASSVNTSIDDPLSGSDVNDRPMLGWIFSDEKYTEQYHQLFEEFIEEWFDSGRLNELIKNTEEMISPYVEKDPTRFCTYEEFEAGVDTITQFVNYRAEAVSRQLSGDNTTVDTNGLNLSDMGTMNSGGGGFGGGPSDKGPGRTEASEDVASDNSTESQRPDMPGGDFGSMPDNMPEGMPNVDFENPPSGDKPSGDFDTNRFGGKGDSGSGTFDPGQISNKDFSGFSGMQGGEKSDIGIASVTGSNSSLKAWLLIGVSLVVLIAGILIAKKK